MTTKELSQLYYLNRELERQQQRLEYLMTGRQKWRALDTVKSSRGPGGTIRVERVYSAVNHMCNPFREEISALKVELKRSLRRCLRARIRLEKYINSVDDSEMRLILSLRYIDLLPWAMVAARVSPYATEDSVRMAHNRFLEKE